MLDTHVYEVIGEVLFRRSDYGQSHIQRCKVIRTRVAGAHIENSGTWCVMISTLVSGYNILHFRTWFADWSDEDLVIPPDMQSGRPVDVAISAESYDYILRTSASPQDPYRTAQDSNTRLEHMHPELVAVLIDSRWEEPLSS